MWIWVNQRWVGGKKKMLNWIDANDEQKIPSFQEQESIWRAIEIVTVNASEVLDTRFIRSLRSCYDNGKVEFFQFDIVGNDHLAWYAARNRWMDIYLFEKFFQLIPVLDQMKGVLDEVQIGKDTEFKWGNSYAVDGELARLLKTGGAYREFGESGKMAKEIAQEFCKLLFDERYEEVQVYENHRAWSKWFFNVAWDATFVWIDHRKQRLSILCATDTD